MLPGFLKSCHIWPLLWGILDRSHWKADGETSCAPLRWSFCTTSTIWTLFCYPFSHNHGSVENHPTWKETNIGDTPIFYEKPWFWEEGYWITVEAPGTSGRPGFWVSGFWPLQSIRRSDCAGSSSFWAEPNRPNLYISGTNQLQPSKECEDWMKRKVQWTWR